MSYFFLQFLPAFHFKLGEDIVDMAFYSAGRDIQCLGNLAVFSVFHQLDKNFLLPGRQPVCSAEGVIVRRLEAGRGGRQQNGGMRCKYGLKEIQTRGIQQNINQSGKQGALPYRREP